MCDAACIKHIINGGFMAALAPVLSDRLPALGTNLEAHEAADKLAEAALAFTGMATVGVTPSFDGFEGCEQAQLLVAWIHDPQKADANKMNEWTAELWKQIADLAAGKLP